MALPQRSFNVRLTPQLADSFDRLARAIPGLRKGAIIRALLAEELQGKTLDAQITVVTRQLLAPSERKPRNGRHGINSRSRIAGEG